MSATLNIPLESADQLHDDFAQRERIDESGKTFRQDMQEPRLQRLAEIFNLSEFDRDIIGALWISTFNTEVRAELLAQEPWNACVTPRAVARMFGHTERARLGSESPLRLWYMVQEQALADGTASLGLDPHILAWLEGQHELDRALIGHATTLGAGIESSEWPLDAWAQMLSEGLRDGVRWRVQIQTSSSADGRGNGDRVAQLACVAGLGQRLGLPVLSMHVRAAEYYADQRMAPAAELLKRLHRQAYLDGCAPCRPIHDVSAPELGIECSPFPLEFVLGPSTGNASPRDDLRADQRHVQLLLPPLQTADRIALWRKALPHAVTWPADELENLGRDSDANATEIMQAAASQPETPQHAAHALTNQYRDELSSLAQRIDASFQWDDLVLPADAIERLREIEFEARERNALWADAKVARLYPQGRGLVALFSGPPGTGKTMAAQVIAAGLGMDLLRVDLSAVVSKWVGETSQHMQKILSARISRRAVLFFDEADALYGKRVEDTKDAHDRYANTDISHLMVALENFDGVVLLATNLKGNIDGAFLRRIRHSVDFTRPDIAARQAIWQRVLAAVFPEARNIRVDQLATLESTGAQIKQAALSAAFAVRRLNCEPHTLLLGQMLARELAKDGGGLSARELASALGQSEGQGVH